MTISAESTDLIAVWANLLETFPVHRECISLARLPLFLDHSEPAPKDIETHLENCSFCTGRLICLYMVRTQMGKPPLRSLPDTTNTGNPSVDTIVIAVTMFPEYLWDQILNLLEMKFSAEVLNSVRQKVDTKRGFQAEMDRYLGQVRRICRKVIGSIEM